MVVQRPKGHRRILVTLELDTLIDPQFHELIRELVTNQTEESTSGEGIQQPPS